MWILQSHAAHGLQAFPVWGVGSEGSKPLPGLGQLGAFRPQVNPGLLRSPTKETRAIVRDRESLGPHGSDELP